MIKAIGFDLDNTLVYHSNEYIFDTVGKTLDELNLPFSDKFALDFWYSGDRDRIIEDSLHIPQRLFWETFWKMDDPKVRLKNTQVFDDVSTLNLIMGKKIKLGIVTGALTQIAYLEINKILDLYPTLKFDSIITNDPSSNMRAKPFPDMLYHFIENVGVLNHQICYVGDNLGDVAAAESAGIEPIIVLRNYNRNFLHEYLGKSVESLYELTDML